MLETAKSLWGDGFIFIFSSNQIRICRFTIFNFPVFDFRCRQEEDEVGDEKVENKEEEQEKKEQWWLVVGGAAVVVVSLRQPNINIIICIF